jgi:tetratricopeptide (TPR) repeat protein
MSDNKRSILEQIEALQSQAKTVMSETTVPVDERIQRATAIYGQAENMADKSGIDDKMHESLLSDSAKFFYYYGMYKEALSRYALLITLRETIYGHDHPITAAAYHDIGEVYRNLCDYPKALEYNIKALDIRKKFLGEKNLETAESYNDTALVFFYQGDYDKATELILKAKDIREEVVGENHPDTAESYANLGLFSLKQEEYVKGLENYSKA